MAKPFEEAIRIGFKTEGEQDVRKLESAIRSFGDATEEVKAEAAGLADEISRATDTEKQIASYKQLEQRLTQSAIEAKQLREEVDKLGAAFVANENPSKRQTAEFQRKADALTKLEAKQAEYGAELRRAGNLLKTAGVDTARLTAEEQRLSQGKQTLLQRLQQMATAARESARGQADAARATRESASAAKSADGALGGLVNRLKGVAAAAVAYLSLNKLKDALIGILATGDKFEGLEQRLTQAFGSAEAGASAFDRIKALAETVPDSLESITESALRLKSFGLDPLNGTLAALIDQNAALGGGQERLNGIILAVGQAWAKQKLQGEEILQMVERGIPVWDLLGKATGKSAVELQKLSEAGKLGRTEIQLLINEMAKASDGAAEKGIGRLSAMWTKLSDIVAAFYNRIAESGPLDYFKGQLEALQTRIKEMTASGELDAFAKRIGEAITTVASAIKNTVVFVGTFIKEITALGAAFVAAKIGAAAGAAATGINLLGASIGRLFGPIGLVVGGLTSLAFYLRSSKTEAENAAPSLAGLTSAIDDLTKSTDDNREANLKRAEALLANVKIEAQILESAAEATEAEAERARAREKMIVAEGRANTSLRQTTIELENEAAAARKSANSHADRVTTAERALESQREQIAATQEQAKATQTLEGAYSSLGLKSKAALDAAAEAARKSYEAIVEGARKGEAAQDDVRAAFEAYAKAQREAVANGTAAQKAQVEATLLAEKGVLDLAAAQREAGNAGKTAAEIQIAAMRNLLANTTATADALRRKLSDAFRSGADPAAIAGLSNALLEADKTAAGAAKSLKAMEDELDALEAKGAKSTAAVSGGLRAVKDEAAAAADEIKRTADAIANETTAAQAGAAASAREAFNAPREMLRVYGDEALAMFDKLFEAAAGADRIIETTGLTYAQSLQRVAGMAVSVAQAMDASISADERKAKSLAFIAQNSDGLAQALHSLGFTVDDLRNGTVNVSTAMSALANQRMDRLRPELEGVAGALQTIEDGARSAIAELANMNREYEKARLQREGNEKALAELAYQEELERIKELEREAGAAGAANAAEARRRAKEEHEARLREIRDEAEARRRAERDGDDPVAAGGGSGGGRPSGGGSGKGPTTQPVRTVRVEFGDDSFDVTEDSAGGVERMLDILRMRRRGGRA